MANGTTNTTGLQSFPATNHSTKATLRPFIVP